jgi:ATP-dependent DNA helicase RecQ
MSTSTNWPLEDILATTQQYWGFSELRPLQEQAIRAGLARRDSLVVMPTGGGKSLCYQIPAALEERTDIVVSPLIALMKDQVDGLRECGYPAAALYSGMAPETIRATEAGMAAGQYRLVFVAPERLLTSRFLQFIDRLPAPAFAIDEAHCISHWGHDFRPEYRQLSELKSRFPGASLHAYTATATERVREDIAQQLRLENPEVLVGVFDRPNLVYRIVPRVDARAQTLDVLRRHSGEAAIVYCISRKDSEAMAQHLQREGIRAAFYHAGMEPEDRRRTQDQFASEEIDVVAATVAFGMGIDRSDVRVVIHAGMPKSVEHYQQETGRAGRDSLEAECVLLYSAADFLKWESLIDRSAVESGADPESVVASRTLLEHMRRFCSGIRCRHRALSEYFGQEYLKDDCAACDTCLGEIEGVPDATITAQKILSCVARAEQRFGAEHIIDILLGADTERVRRWRHERLSTYGLMKGVDRKGLTAMLYQLVDSGVLERTNDERPVLKLNEQSWAVMRGQREVKLLQPRSGVRKTRFDETSWEGVDRPLFERLRAWRHREAQHRNLPAYMLFSDASLRDLARVRPGTPSALLKVRGIGERKQVDLGPAVLALIQEYCAQNDLAMNVSAEAPARLNTARVSAPKPPKTKERAFEMFLRNAGVPEVAQALERSPSTVWGYLGEFIAQHPELPIDPWVSAETFRAIADAATAVGKQYQKPIFDYLGGSVPYEQIRMTLARLNSSVS